MGHYLYTILAQRTVFHRRGMLANRQRNAWVSNKIRTSLYLPSHRFNSFSGSGSKKASIILIFPFMEPNFRVPRSL